jgi:sec-independent protein translocase protein TatA
MRIGTLGIWELLFILILVLLIFGSRRLPNVTKSFFESFREFRRGLRGARNSSASEPSDDETGESDATPQHQP